MKYMTDSIGLPPRSFIQKGSRKSIFFDQAGKLRPEIKNLKATMDMFSKPLRERIQDQDFLRFIECFLKWDPEERVSAVQALNHPWISKGLPEELRNKLSGSRQLAKSRQKRQSSSTRMKGRSKEKSQSVSKLMGKSSQQKIKKSYCLKF